MELIRQLARETWTDHHVHDPGITLLEAFIYAMTELGFRIQLDMPDLLRSGEAHGSADLVPAHRALPCGPVTSRDLRHLLLDHPLVSDARITTEANSDVPFYEDETVDPPFTYAPGTRRVRPSGLFEVMIEFEERIWNSNTYTLQVDAGGQLYSLDMALPHWDEDQAAPFRTGATINTVSMQPDGTVAWRPLEESQTYFGELQVDYTDADGSAAIVLWVLLNITGTLAQPALVTPVILDAARSVVETIGAGSLIARFEQRVQAAYGAVQEVQRYLETWRNLCEAPIPISVARVQEIAIRAHIEVTSSHDLEHMLADIFLAIDHMLSPPLRFYSLAELRDRGKDTEHLFNGPLLQHGFLDEAEVGGPANPSEIYLSDILRLIMLRRSPAGTDLITQENPTGRDIVAVTNLTVSNYVNNRPITVDAKDCLHLVEVERYRPRLSLAKSRIILVRNGAEVNYDTSRVANLFPEMQEQARTITLPQNPSPIWPVPRGEALPVEDYYPIQNDLPPLYGVGETGLAPSASRERRATALQLQGYLLLFEQFLADITAQLGHINRFFTANPEAQATYFTRALLDLPEVHKLLRSFPSGGDWQAFVSDPQNPYRRALQEGVESRDHFLDRRNRMLDHLLARQGEETVAWAQELHRWAQTQLAEANLQAMELPAGMEARRRAANAHLIRSKAAFLLDAPELNANRMQAFGNPLRRRNELLRIEPSGSDYNWTLTLDGQALLRSVTAYATPGAATIAAEEAMILAAQNTFYDRVPVPGGEHRYRVKDGPEATARVVGESLQTWLTEPAAQSALAAAAARFAAIRLEASLTPMEQRIAHLTGIRRRVRQRLLVPGDAFFEIFDNGVSTEKSWRLWEFPGYSGRELLSSVSSFTAPTEEEAIMLAGQSIRQVMRYGMDVWHYQVSPVAPDLHTF
ncbi:MAG: hypothetical protein ETSY2_31285 [Candidatus Entotheonella gemina]|uniref:Uncharacterized protein n=1 Tax=Candidatus Entotheonella gemina TaxID=1429439 RepID=W4M1E2_9BACT|nr:MAG: hypothetical protein ETSY2_31285 [Candidatus Entotheonella gemina]